MKECSLYLLLAALGSAACNPTFYNPDTHNVPLLSARGQAAASVTGNSNQAEAQAAYAVSENVAIKAEGGVFFPRDLDNGNGGSGAFVGLGGGFFRALTKHIILEAYGIVGFGGFENHLPSTVEDNPGTEGDISAKLIRYGFQPNIGYRSKYFSAALSSRFVRLSYFDIDGDLIFDGDDEVAFLQDNRSTFLVEPALTLRGGLENLKLQMQFGFSRNLSNSDFRQEDSNLTVGLFYNAAL